ncbi:MAG: response regulator PleD [Methanoregula sp. PtaU1.Bin051]|nr:MAG: response regulator PleD [Methanoregula sp. PtaU1.Bin051]
MPTILIVDDDPDIADVFRIFLADEGHTALTASGGIQCLKMLQGISPDLILLDLIMHPMDGWTTLKAIKDNPDTKEIPVIMITGKPQFEEERQLYSPLYYEYLTKPIRRTELCAAVNTALSAP